MRSPQGGTKRKVFASKYTFIDFDKEVAWQSRHERRELRDVCGGRKSETAVNHCSSYKPRLSGL